MVEACGDCLAQFTAQGAGARTGPDGVSVLMCQADVSRFEATGQLRMLYPPHPDLLSCTHRAPAEEPAPAPMSKRVPDPDDQVERTQDRWRDRVYRVELSRG
jgi:hypothetical protein